METRQVTGILPALRECSEDDASFIAGCIGLRFKHFADRISLDRPHPDIFSFAGGSLAQWTPDSYNQLFCDIIKLGTYMRVSGLWNSNLISALHQILANATSAEMIKLIGDPGSNLLNIRFAVDRSYRDLVRGKKSQQPIGMKAVCSMGCDYWSHLPDFRSYWRGTNSLASDIEKAENRRRHFVNLGLDAMAQEVQVSIDQIKAQVASTQHHGFNRITLQMTAAILVKLCGFTFHKKPRESEGAIFAFKDSFPGYDFYDPSQENSMYSRLGKVECVPYCKPLVKMRSVPATIKETVNFLEQFPEVSGHPLFDNYWVVMPLVHYPSSYMSCPTHFVDKQGNCREFDRVDEAQEAFTQELFDNHYIVGALLGEKDGEHYFVCYWVTT